MPAKKLSQDIKQLVDAIQLQHIAIIMDGNRRWAQAKHLPSIAGHGQGVETLKKLVRYSGEVGLKTLTVYAFSTENWQRSTEEVGYLMKLFVQALSKELDALHQNQVRLRFIGDLSILPSDLQALLEKAMAKTAQNSGLCLQVATNYGARAELVNAFKQLAQQVQQGEIIPEQITEESISTKLSTEALEPDLLIRTGGEQRLSNFLLWQCAYSELYFTSTLWPDFSPAELDKAITTFAIRERRFGQ